MDIRLRADYGPNAEPAIGSARSKKTNIGVYLDGQSVCKTDLVERLKSDLTAVITTVAHPRI